MKCVYCNSEKIVKNGKSNQGKQIYAKNEGLHSFLRIKLAMLKRKTKAYAKYVRALYRALALVFIRWNLLSTF